MPIEMPKGLPFSVDTWTSSSKRKRHHFLTHAHKDHSFGISSHFSFPIYSTLLTKSLVLQHYPQLDDSLFVEIEIGQSVVVDDPDGAFTVTAFDANHCPGAVMFLFEENFGNILHAGDFRLIADCVQSLPKKFVGKRGKVPRCQLDYVFLDCTFGRFRQNLPSKYSAIQQVINCIWKHPDAPVVLDGFPKLYERAKAKLLEAQAHCQPAPLIIRPSAQWYACEEEFSENESQRKLRMNEALLDIATEDSPDVDVSIKSVSGSSIVEEHTQTYAQPQFEPVKVSTGLKGLIKLSPPSKKVTLFGRARLGLQDFSFSHEGPTVASINNNPPQISANKVEEFSFQEEAEVKCHKSESKTGVADIEVQCLKSVDKETEVLNTASLTIGSSKRYSERLRKFCRKMNVPVPQPLPSLVELMKANKRAKRKFEL
nr:5' exonuclease apollo [Quercus suber]